MAALSYSVDTDVTGTVTTKIQEFEAVSPVSWVSESWCRRAWQDNENHLGDPSSAASIFYATSPLNYSDAKWLYEDADYGMAFADIYQSNSGPALPRITTQAATPDITQLAGRDISNLLAATQSEVDISGRSGFVVDAASASELDNWFYPTPTHLSVTASGSVHVMSGVAPTHPRAYRQPYLRDAPNTLSHPRLGIGGYLADDGFRLIQPTVYATDPGTMDENYGAGKWIRPGIPIMPLIPFNQWGTAINSGSGGIPLGYNSAYGLPPIEVSGNITVPAGDAAPSMRLFLYQWKADLTFDGGAVIATSAAMTFTGTDGFNDSYILQPVDSGHSTTLDNDTLMWFVQAISTVTSDTFSRVGAFWHKVPCHIQPYALSSAVDGIGEYLPGWLYDPFA